MEPDASIVIGEKALRKKQVKARQKAARDHQPESIREHRRDCDECGTPKDVLIRCQDDDSGQWKMLCTAGCWQKASGGQIDGTSETPYYRYSGIWKNRHADVTGKMPKKLADLYITRSEYENGRMYSKNDVVFYQGATYICRSAVMATEEMHPVNDHHHWKSSD